MSDTGVHRRRTREGNGNVTVAALVATASVLAAMVAVAVTAVAATGAYLRYGLPDPGAVTRYGLPAVRVLAEAAATVCIGSLLLAAFGIPARRSGGLAADGYAAVRTAGWSAAAWCVGSVLTLVFTAASATGRPVGRTLRADVLLGLLGALAEARAWLVTASIAFVLAVACRFVLSWGGSILLFAGSLAGLFPLVATGHSASGGAHDVATSSLLFHVFAAVLWVGGLVALLAHVARGGNHAGLVARRFSAVALGCWVVLAASGVVNAFVRISVGELFTTTYGALLLVKITALGVLGLVGYQQRRHNVALIGSGGAGALMRLGAFEVLTMFATLGVAVALGRTPPPGEVTETPGTVELLIGYPLHGPPTAWRLLSDIRFDLVYGTIALGAAVLYLLAVRRLTVRGDHWPWGRTLAWLCGCAAILIATSSGVGRYAPAMFSVHMAQHMLLSMLAPALLVLGGPTSLALRALRPAGRGHPPGMREWLLSFLHSRLTRVLTHPVVALVLFVGSFYGLYFTSLFEFALSAHWAHIVMNGHFLVVGYLFYWPVIGVDPAPRKLPPLGKLGMVFASMPFHAFFGIALMMSSTPIGANFYRSLDLPWVTDLLADQRAAGALAWASGEVPLIVVLLALLIQWSRADARTARRLDRKAVADDDADLAAYNAMLRTLSERGSADRES